MKEVRILVKEQKKIDFINDYNAIVDYLELKVGILSNMNEEELNG